MEIVTSRLRLHCLTAVQLKLLQADPAKLAAELNITIPSTLLTPPFERAIGIKLNRLAGIPTTRHAWYTYWLIIHTAEMAGIGLVGFKGLSEEGGEAEIGYGMDETFRGGGLMTEAVKAMVEWAQQDPSCTAITASLVRPDNYPSQRVLEKVGFTRLRQGEDGVWFRLENPKRIT